MITSKYNPKWSYILLTIILCVVNGCSSDLSTNRDPILESIATIQISEPTSTTPAGGKLLIKAPDIAENGSVVPIGIDDERTADKQDPIEEMLLYNCKENSEIGYFQFTDRSQPVVTTRVRIPRGATVVATAITRDGSILSGSKNIKVTMGGSGGGGGSEGEHITENGAQVGDHYKTRNASYRQNGIPSTLSSHTLTLENYDDENGKATFLSRNIVVKSDGFRVRVLIDLPFTVDNADNSRMQFKLRLPDGATPYYLSFGEFDVDEPNSNEPIVNSETQTNKIFQDSGFSKKEIPELWNSVNNHLRPAVLVERELAKSAYSDTVYRNIDPALMQWEGAGIFSVDLFPIFKEKTYRVIIGYDYTLSPTGNGMLDIPAINQSPTRIVTYTPEQPYIEKGTSVQTSKIGDHQQTQFRATDKGVRIRFKNNMTQPVSYIERISNFVSFSATSFLVTFPLQPKVSENSLLLLDRSASMSIIEIKDILTRYENFLANHENSVARFQVIHFNHQAISLDSDWLDNSAINRGKIDTLASNMSVSGSSDIYQAIKLGKLLLNNQSLSLVPVTIVSDGVTNWGHAGWAHYLQTEFSNQLVTFITPTSVSRDHILNQVMFTLQGRLMSLLEHDPKLFEKSHTIPWRVYIDGNQKLEQTWIDAQRAFITVYENRIASWTEGVGYYDREFSERVNAVFRDYRDEPYELVQAKRFVQSDLVLRQYGKRIFENAVNSGEKNEQLVRVSKYYRLTNQTTSLLMLESDEEYERYGIESNDNLTHIQHYIPKRAVRNSDASVEDPRFGSLKSVIEQLPLEPRYLVSLLNFEMFDKRHDSAIPIPLQTDSRLVTLLNQLETSSVLNSMSVLDKIEESFPQINTIPVRLTYLNLNSRESDPNRYVYQKLARLFHYYGDLPKSIIFHELANFSLQAENFHFDDKRDRINEYLDLLSKLQLDNDYRHLQDILERRQKLFSVTLNSLPNTSRKLRQHAMSICPQF